MDVRFVPEVDPLPIVVLPDEAIRHLGRLEPAAGEALLGAVPQVRLVPRIRGNRPPVRTRLMRQDGLMGRHERRVFDHEDAALVARVVLRPEEESGDLVERILGSPSAVRTVVGIRVDPHVVPVVDPEGLRVLRVDVHLMLADALTSVQDNFTLRTERSSAEFAASGIPKSLGRIASNVGGTTIAFGRYGVASTGSRWTIRFSPVSRNSGSSR